MNKAMDLICITCPNGCHIHGVMDETGNLQVEGNKCPKGKDFAQAEMKNPTRTLTTTVKTQFKEMPYLPVRTDGNIPKSLISKALEELRKIKVSQVLTCGDVVVPDIAGTGVRVIATADIPE